MKVLTRLAGVIALASSLSFGLTSGAFAQYPDRPITIIVPFAAGGPTDVVARIMREPLSRILKQQVLVENVTGAGGTVGVTRAKNAAPDGYTLLMGNLGTQAASVGLYPKLAYDPRTDFEPIIEYRRHTDAGGCQEGSAGQGFQGIRDISEGQCRQNELRHRRRRRDFASHLPVPRFIARRTADACAVPRLRTGT